MHFLIRNPCLLFEVAESLLDEPEVLLLVLRLEGHAGRDGRAAAVHLERPDRGHQHHRVRSETGKAALKGETDMQICTGGSAKRLRPGYVNAAGKHGQRW